MKINRREKTAESVKVSRWMAIATTNKTSFEKCIKYYLNLKYLFSFGSIAIIFVVCVLILFTITSLHFSLLRLFALARSLSLSHSPTLFIRRLVCSFHFVSFQCYWIVFTRQISVAFSALFVFAYECLVNRKLHFLQQQLQEPTTNETNGLKVFTNETT